VAGRFSTSNTINKFYDLRILAFEEINKLQISEFKYRFTHNLLSFVFQVIFLMYLIFILTTLVPVKTYAISIVVIGEIQTAQLECLLHMNDKLYSVENKDDDDDYDAD